MRIFVDLWRFALVRKKFWLIPVMILAVAYGALAVFTKGSVLAPVHLHALLTAARICMLRGGPVRQASVAARSHVLLPSAVWRK